MDSITFQLHPIDWAVVIAYFAIVAFIGIVMGQKKTKTLSDFFIAGGRWGPLVAFVFVFASAVGGAEAVVVGAGAYRSGVSGIWYWWAGIFSTTTIYFLFSTIYKRSRVFNLAEFFEMRFGWPVAIFYALLGIVVCILMLATFQLGVGKIISGLSGISVDQAVLAASILVSVYVASGGMMSSLLTDLFQGVLTLTAFSFLLLPFLWEAAGGFEGLQGLPPEVWSLQSKELTPSYIFTFGFAGFGAIASPFLFSWIVVGKDERTATQCAWGHLWKRVITILFSLYGLLFAVYKPDLVDPELAWGLVMREIIPVGFLGLLVASFFSALMSTVDTMATSSSALLVDYVFKKKLFPSRRLQFYLRSARIWSFLVIFLSYLVTKKFSNIVQFLEMISPISLLLSVPLYAGIVWRRSNRQGMWASLWVGIGLLCMTRFWLEMPFETTVFLPTIGSVTAMLLVSYFTRPESDVLLNRFYCILNTPIGKENRLRRAGIRLPAMEEGTGADSFYLREELDREELHSLYQSYATHKLFGSNSSIEVRKEPGLDWYYRGCVLLFLGICLLVSLYWLACRMMATY